MRRAWWSIYLSGPPAPGLRPFSQDDIEFGGDYAVPYASVGGRVAGDLNCVGSYSQPYGADSEYSGPITFHVAEQTLSTNEFGLTCGYGFDLSKGRLSVIGGAFYETIEYGQARNFETAFANSRRQPCRFGLQAPRIPGRAGLRNPRDSAKAQLMYRSQTNHDATGEYTNTPFRR